jgi:hypothetical protein
MKATDRPAASAHNRITMNFSPSLLTIGAVALAITLTGCKSRESARTRVPPPPILAEVDGAAVTEAQFRLWWDRHPPASDQPQTRAGVLDDLIHRQALLQRARAAGLHEDPQVRESINSLLVARLEELELQPALAALEVSEQEARALYEAEQHERFTRPAARRAALLWFETRGQAPLARRYQPRLAQVRSILTADPAASPASEGFGPLAIANSEHRATRFQGGDLGWLDSLNESDPVRAAAAEIADSLTTPGQLSEVIVRDEGVFLVRLLESREARTKPFAEVRPQIEQRLLAQRRRDLREQFHARMAAGIVVTRFPYHLRALTDLPLSPPDPAPAFGPALSQLTSPK